MIDLTGKNEIKKSIESVFNQHVEHFKTDIYHDFTAIDQLPYGTNFLYLLRETGSHLIAIKSGDPDPEDKSLLQSALNMNEFFYFWDSIKLSKKSKIEAKEICFSNEMVRFFG